MRRPLRAAGLLVGVVVCMASPGWAQRVELRVGSGPYYLDVPVELQLIVEDFDEDPQPEIEFDPPANGRLELLGVSPSVSSQVTIINGRVTRTKDVRFVYRYRFLAERPGRIQLGPFHVRQGARQSSTRSLVLTLTRVPLSDRLRVRLMLPREPIFVGSRFTVQLEWWLERGLRENLHDYTLRAPIFDLRESFQFIDEEGQRGSTDFTVKTSRGPLKLAGHARERSIGGRRFLVISARRTAVALKPGTIALEPATVVASEGTSWKRQLFGGRRATRVRKLRAVDQARTLEVKALPAAGRPESFAGAIGRGFSLEVSADRTVVKVGDPITLSITLRGEGNLESAGLPPLSADGGLSPRQFRLPEEEPTGFLEGSSKSFTSVVRVVDPAVTEIPAIAYSWFDPEARDYRTTRSRPIALSVRGAQVVRAEDVVSPSSAEPGVPSTRSEPSGAGEPAEAREGLRRSIRVTAADLAIQRSLGRLLAQPAPDAQRLGLALGLHLGPLLLVALAVLLRRRADRDPVRVRRQRFLAMQHRRIQDLVKRGDPDAAPEISAALRRMLAQLPEARSVELDRLLAACDEISFAPAAGQTRGLQAELGEQARALSRAILERQG